MEKTKKEIAIKRKELDIEHQDKIISYKNE